MAATSRPRSAAKKTVLASTGCRLLASIEPVDRNAAEGRRSVDVAPSFEEARRLVDEERRRTTTDTLQKFVLDAKFLFRNGGFGLSQNESCIQRITALGRAKVTNVDLSHMHLSDLLVESLANYLSTSSCIVVSLNVAGTKIVPTAVLRLAAACGPKVEFFTASRTQLVTAVVRSKRVVLPRVGGDHLDVAAIAAFVGAKKKPLVEVLDLSSNDLTGPEGRRNLFGGVELLANVLAKCSKLTRVILNNVHLRSDGLVLLALGLQHTTSIHYLEMGRNAIQTNVSNQVCYNGIDSLCEALRANHSIRELSLPQNDLDYTCVTKLTAILAVNDTVETLDLSQNPLGSAALCPIATVLHANIPLKSLNLSATQASCKGCVSLADSLLHNTTLTSIDLSQNPGILAVGLTTLAGAMERNATLTRIKVSPTEEPALTEPLGMLQQLTAANVALGTMRKALTSFDFASLSPFAQVNFVNKLDAWTEDELRALVANPSFVQAKLSTSQVSALEYYASLNMYTPLKRLLWAYGALGRETASRYAATVRDDDDDALWNDQALVDLAPLCSL
ncbi:hypothetical protein H310_08938 [Aphanomyces invadans]|uniref:Uncharacterized protein n=1 Tax=Aphanomyces invadans TaxID=157072 RepID=A0A024TVM5_9STRA|nr:hypothetical protein H310_08938 [Aphanomyces invadans]ETV98215.1 hypothetical protein H310_08938 [Aphanomyces invadans]|eukprot:XP_008873090.1 hypothetical protein H310_08938 [Aphanomyces invadans]